MAGLAKPHYFMSGLWKDATTHKTAKQPIIVVWTTWKGETVRLGD